MLKNESWRENTKRWRQAPSRALAASFDSCHDCLGLLRSVRQLGLAVMPKAASATFAASLTCPMTSPRELETPGIACSTRITTADHSKLPRCTFGMSRIGI